ncbi:MAG: putative DNA-binding domain-containing protein [Candidatus Obscuribacterales bacterium]|nr:putative DNA-binding domain-containing protein [Candidatus Obscuribacterales bacterium]
MTTSLRSIEKSLATLWTKDAPRQTFLGGGGEASVEPGVEPVQIDPRGVKMYATLIRTGRQDLMQSIYPGCSKILSRTWQKLVDQYMETRPPSHYNLNKAAGSFSDFLRNDMPELVMRHPFLPELADYEWIELEILESPDKAVHGDQLTLDDPSLFQSHGPVLNTVLVIRHYQYPIAKLVDWLREDVRLPRRLKKGATHLAIYRDPHELTSRFLELGELSSKMIEQLMPQQMSYAELLAWTVTESKSKNPQETVLKTIELFDELNRLNVFVGSKKLG